MGRGQGCRDHFVDGHLEQRHREHSEKKTDWNEAELWRLNEASTQVLEHKGHVTRVG